MSGAIGYERSQGAALLTIDAPERRNALSHSALAELCAALERARDDGAVGAVILTGAGDIFCSGGDLSEFALAEELPARFYETREIVRVFRAMSELGKPLIAAVNGHAIGIGLGLALSCDLVVAADDARFSAPEIEIGIYPFMITPIVRRSVPRIAANGILLLGDSYAGDDAVRLGLANRTAPRDAVLGVAHEWAAHLAQTPPALMRIGRDALHHGEGLPLAAELDFMHSHLPVALTNDETRGRLRELLDMDEREGTEEPEGDE